MIKQIKFEKVWKEICNSVKASEAQEKDVYKGAIIRRRKYENK